MASPHEGSIRRPIAPRTNALTTELHLAPDGLAKTLCYNYTQYAQIMNNGYIYIYIYTHLTPVQRNQIHNCWQYNYIIAGRKLLTDSIVSRIPTGRLFVSVHARISSRIKRFWLAAAAWGHTLKARLIKHWIQIAISGAISSTNRSELFAYGGNGRLRINLNCVCVFVKPAGYRTRKH